MKEMHSPVLLNEVVDLLEAKPGDVVLDTTLGFGGHASALLNRLSGKGLYIGLDQDPVAVAHCQQKFADHKNIQIHHLAYTDFSQILDEAGIGKVDRVLMDLGVSSEQLDNLSRGFSFKSQTSLDMRMDTERMKHTAADVVNTWEEFELRKLFFEYGEERFSGRIAKAIVTHRSREPFENADQLAKVIERAVPSFYRYGKIHPATRTFQALRLAVNSELKVLKKFMADVVTYLGSGSRIAVISFHSLEDRIIKNTFRQWQSEKFGKVITKKPITATETEVHENPRSRSAKLRVFEMTSQKEGS